jgi:hypothetical protein
MVVVAAFGVVGNITFSRLKVPFRSAKKLKKKKKHSTFSDTFLTNSYKLGFSLIWDQPMFNLIPNLLIHSILPLISRFLSNFMQLHPCQIHLSTFNKMVFNLFV